MRCAGYVLTDELGGVVAVSVGTGADLVKSFAAAKKLEAKEKAPESAQELADEHKHLVNVLRSPSHKDDLQEADKQEKELTQYQADAEREKAGDPVEGDEYGHPSVVGKADKVGQGGFQFAGRSYTHTGQTGKSLHDETPVRAAESEDGHKVWIDEKHRVHADDSDEVQNLRGRYEAMAAKKSPKK